MASQLMLVIVVVVACLAGAAAALLRAKNTLHRPTAGAAAGMTGTPPASRPGRAEGPAMADLTRTAAKESDNSGPDPQPGQVRTGAGTPTPRVELPSSAYGDGSELDFTLEIPDNGRAPTADTHIPFPTPADAGPSFELPTGGPATGRLQAAEVFAQFFGLALGKARAATTVTADHDDVVTAVGTVLPDIATQDRYAPRRPDMLPKVLSASNDDGFSRRELAALIARDPSLVGNLLKIANSSYYRVTPEPVESVERAVVLLGTDGIRSLVTAALMQPIFRIGGADFPRFPEIAWEHTFRSASAAVAYNFLVEKSDPFVAELLSLVMGLAAIAIFRVTLDQYAKYPRLRPDADVLSSLLDKHSATVARQIGTSWELSTATLSGLDGQTTSTTCYPTALGRSLYFGRVVGALALLRINHVIDDDTARASIPATTIPEPQLERMWARLTPRASAAARPHRYCSR